MRDLIIGASLLLVAALSWVLVMTTDSQAESRSNEVMKECLAKHGYTPEGFQTFDFSKPAGCHSDYRISQRKVEYEKQREFLAEHPWYKGKNWKWEERAEYTCIKRYDMSGMEFCFKPIYLN
jgi:lipopolysaccharide export system protein LptC